MRRMSIRKFFLKSGGIGAGTIGNDKIALEIALPKEHILEAMAAGKMIDSKMAEARKTAREAAEKKAAGETEDPNNSGQVDDVNEQNDSSDEPLNDPCSLDSAVDANG